MEPRLPKTARSGKTTAASALAIPYLKQIANKVIVKLKSLEKGNVMEPSFTLSEQFAFGSQYSWRLKEGEIRFRGSGEYQRLVLRRIPASEAQIASFLAALDLLQVWEWRSDYDSQDVGCLTLDGSSWSFTASFGVRNCACGGVNGFPSFEDPKKTTPDRGRLSLLQAALYDCFGVEAYIYEAKKFAEREEKQRGEQHVVPE